MMETEKYQKERPSSTLLKMGYSHKAFQVNGNNLVAEDYRAASVFGNYGIDFCCQGNRTINDACINKGLDTSKVVRDLKETLSAQNTSSIDYKSWPLDMLSDYVEKKHHRYVEKKIPIIRQSNKTDEYG